MLKSNMLVANWPAHKRVKTLITTRDGGYSIDEFNSLNLALHVNDNPEHVLHNRKLLQQQLPDKPYWLNQTHSNKIINLDTIHHNPTNVETALKQSESEDEFDLETGISPLKYDASITTCRNKVCVVLTADCLPILITNKQGTFVAAIHAGWRGVENSVIKNTIQASNSDLRDILVYIGPAICQNHFEVGGEVLEQFTSLDPANAKFFIEKTTAGTTGKYNCDLTGIAKLQLLNLGVLDSNIYLSNLCTYCREDLFYSYRKQNITGRFASLIWLE